MQDKCSTHYTITLDPQMHASVNDTDTGEEIGVGTLYLKLNQEERCNSS